MQTELLKKRNIEFDVARGIAIFLMIIQHTWQLIFSGFFHSSTLDSAVLFVAIIFGAPVFLFLMGANIVSSHNSDPRSLFFRGLKLIIFGYALSFFRFYLPLILLQYFGIIENPERIIYHLRPLDYLLEIDIFQVAGLSLVGISLLRWQKIRPVYYLVIALIVALISPMLFQLNFVNPVLVYLVEPFFGVAEYVLFPFFPWFVYSLIGFYFGTILIKVNDKKRFYQNALLKMIPIFYLGFILLLVDPNLSSLSFWRHNLGSVLMMGSFVVFWLGIINFNYYRLSDKFLSILTFCSKNVTVIYVIQWIALAWFAIITKII
jgi:uncharacterized membrane protein